MPSLLFEITDNIAYITINRPEAMNAINAEVRRGWKEAWLQVRDDDGVLCAIISGAGGRAFSAGADIKEMDAASQSDIDLDTLKSMNDFPRPTQELGVWKPIIAAIDGYCLGGGLVIAMDADIRVTSDKSILGMPETGLALVAGWWASARAARLLPLGVALEMFLAGGTITAQQALHYGLVNHVVPSAQVMGKAREIARKICSNGPLAVRSIKEVMHRSLSGSLEEAARLEESLMYMSMLSEDAREGARAFIEKRKPKFTGK